MREREVTNTEQQMGSVIKKTFFFFFAFHTFWLTENHFNNPRTKLNI